MFKKIISIFIYSFLCSQQLVQACSVCFGGGASNLTRGFFWGVLFLLALPITMAAVFVGVIVRSTRKNKMNQNQL